ncbi:MAG: DUF5320 domain-containing protein [Candidatus Buchananbacteria bacterium]|nr:DUF5320 domain-containing protein [Candidatus Buchananbacteria bacterium]
MPNLDGTGPNGQGPKTGRQMGNCEDSKPRTAGARGPRGTGRRMAGQGLRGQRSGRQSQ